VYHSNNFGVKASMPFVTYRFYIHDVIMTWKNEQWTCNKAVTTLLIADEQVISKDEGRPTESIVHAQQCSGKI
jgi:hypothetical protein